MGGKYRPRQWPQYALRSLEDSRDQLADAKTAVRAAQEAALEGNRQLLIILLADIRDKVAKADLILAHAKIGEYEKDNE
jgi:hypothetical protein